jgi:hypothetical protein
MNLDELVKYIIWIVFFGLALTALYFVLKNLGVV